VSTFEAVPLAGVRSYHAEGPLWDPATEELLWVDIYAGLVQRATLETPGGRLRYGDVDTYRIGEQVGAVVPMRDPAAGWMLASQYGFSALRRDGEVSVVCEPERGALPATRMNDGKCDPRGNFWAGSMGNRRDPGAGTLYRLAPDLTCVAALNGVTISNGLAWDGPGRAYYIDSPTGRIDVLTLDDNADVLARTMAFRVPDGWGVPDGMTVDADGCLWVALWGGGRVVRFSLAGVYLAEVRVAASQVSSCTFGGPDLSTLFVTTSQEEFTAEQSAAEPLAGHVFAVDVGVRGLPPDRFGRGGPDSG
jgi:sugar lactone lactonase YvrE